MSTTTSDALKKLTRDLKEASATLSRDEARYLCDLYYQIQDARIRSAGQIRAIEQDVDEGATHETLSFFLGQFETLESQIKRALGAYALSKVPGIWAQSICGIGDVISAGLVAHVNIERASHAGAVWKFAGICNPSVDVWNKGEKRPWNASFKALVVFKLGECFVKVQNREADYYGKLFAARRAMYAEKNRQGAFVEEAARILSVKNFNKNTDAYAWYSGCFPASIWEDYYSLTSDERLKRGKQLKRESGSGQPMLPPAQIHARARRYAVKRFLSHYHEVAYFDHFQRLPARPFIIDIGGHADYEPPPNAEKVPGLVEALAKR